MRTSKVLLFNKSRRRLGTELDVAEMKMSCRVMRRDTLFIDAQTNAYDNHRNTIEP